MKRDAEEHLEAALSNALALASLSPPATWTTALHLLGCTTVTCVVAVRARRWKPTVPAREANTASSSSAVSLEEAKAELLSVSSLT